MTAHAAAAEDAGGTAKLLRPYRTLVAAGVGGMCGIIVGFPFDTVKTKMQTYGFKTMGDCSRYTMKHEGFRGFYRGIIPPFCLVTVMKALSFQVYESGRTHLSLASGMDRLSLPVVMGAGILSGTMAAFANCPFDLIKINMQLARLRAAKEGANAPMTSWSTAREVVRTRGFFGLYLGLSALIARDGIGTAVYFGTYESIYRIAGVSRQDAPSSAHMAAGGLAGMASWMAIFPVDLVKSRVPKDALSPSPAYKGLLDCASRIIKENGVRALYNGLQPTLVRAFPIHAVNFLVYERVLAIIGTD